MGSYSELYFANSLSSPVSVALAESDDPYLQAKYHVPLLWLALFEPTDIADSPPEDDATSWPHLAKPTSKASALLLSRQEMLARHFPALQALWVKQFLSMLEGATAKYVHVETSDIGAMVERPAGWRRELRSMLGIFNVPPTAPSTGLIGKLFGLKSTSREWQVFNRRLGSVFDGPDGVESWVYCGSSATDEAMPWEFGA